ncbi:MAG: cation diffusion facilitator family transporter [Alistipes sp.]
MTSEVESRKHEIYHVTIIGFVVNLVLSFAKLAAGIFGRSGAMVADAIHSFSDLATDVVVIAFARISAKPKDEGHDFGHGKYETLATIIISLALVLVGAGILASSIRAIHQVIDGQLLPRPGFVAFLAAALSIISKEILYRYTVRVGRKISSPSVVANAWHHRSDALSSMGTLVGIGCAYFLGDKWRIADPIAALVVAIFIFKIAFDLIRTGLDELLERSLPENIEQEMLDIVTENPEVVQPHNLRTRRIGASVAIEVHVRMNGAMSVAHSHQLTVDIEHRLRARFGQGTMIAVHVEPLKTDGATSK